MPTFLLWTIQKSPRARARTRARPRARAREDFCIVHNRKAVMQFQKLILKILLPLKEADGNAEFFIVDKTEIPTRAHTWGRRLGMRTSQGALAHPCRRTAHGTAHLGAPPRDADQAGRLRASLPPHFAQRGAARGAT